MARRSIGVALVLAAIAACSSLPPDPTGIVALQVAVPDSLGLGPGDSLTLHATAFNISGDSIPAVVRWRTPDTALITLDSVSGLIVAKTDAGSPRVQASAGSLLSNIVTLFLRPDTATTIRAGS